MGNGRVGIGTASPSEKLHVEGKIRIGTQATATTDAVRADRSISTGSGLSGGGNLTANRTFSVDSTVIRTTGNQSMSGTKTFTGTLSYNRLSGPSSQTRDKIRVWSSGFYAIGMMNGYNYGALGSSDYAMSFQMNNSDTRGFWWGDDAHNNNQGAMSLSTNGKLTVAHSTRIGYGESDTTVPGASHRLDVSGNANITGTLTTTRTDGTSQMRSPIYYDRGNTSYLVRPANTGTSGTRLRGVRMDHLGVGTSSTGSTGQIRATNNITAYASDKRLKQNIINISNPIRKIKSINGVHFDWDLKECNKWGFEPPKSDTGLLAQEIQEVLPDAVKPAPFDGTARGGSKSGKDYLTVQYEKVVPLLVEAIKEQQTQIDEQQKQIDKLVHLLNNK
jgi:hypothetical protein